MARYTGEVAARSNPVAIVLLGQPGAGKSVIAEELCRSFVDDGNCVVVAPDELLLLHPDHSSAEDSPGSSRALDVKQVVEGACRALWETASRDRKNLVLDGVAKAPDDAVQLVSRLRDRSYYVIVIALRVDADESWRCVSERDLSLRQETGVGLGTTESEHREACQQLPRILEALREGKPVHEYYVIRRDGRVHEQELATANVDPRRERQTCVAADRDDTNQDDESAVCDRVSTDASKRPIRVRGFQPNVDSANSASGSGGPHSKAKSAPSGARAIRVGSFPIADPRQRESADVGSSSDGKAESSKGSGATAPSDQAVEGEQSSGSSLSTPNDDDTAAEEGKCDTDLIPPSDEGNPSEETCTDDPEVRQRLEWQTRIRRIASEGVG